MTMNNERKVIELQHQWAFMQKGITKLKNLLERVPEQKFNSDEYVMLYTTIYSMCTQKPLQDYSQQLYDRYRESFEECVNSMVLIARSERKAGQVYVERACEEMGQSQNHGAMVVMVLQSP